MKKLLFTLAIVCGAAYSSLAQHKPVGGFSIGADVAAPTGTASEVYNIGLGGSIDYTAPVAPNAFFAISGGYEAFFVKDIFKDLGGPSSDGYIPVKAGIRYYFNEGFFGDAMAGASFYVGDGGFTAFAYSGGLGYTFNIGPEVSVRYEGWSKDGTMGQVALRLAYRFK